MKDKKDKPELETEWINPLNKMFGGFTEELIKVAQAIMVAEVLDNINKELDKLLEELLEELLSEGDEIE